MPGIARRASKPRRGSRSLSLGGVARHVLNKYLGKHGSGPGLLMADENNDLKKEVACPREMYSTDQAIAVVQKSISERLSKKNRGVCSGYPLLIDLDFTTLPFGRWSLMLDDLQEEANDLPFSEVHVVGPSESGPCGSEIK